MRKTVSRMYMEESYFVPTDNHENVTLQHTWARGGGKGGDTVRLTFPLVSSPP